MKSIEELEAIPDIKDCMNRVREAEDHLRQKFSSEKFDAIAHYLAESMRLLRAMIIEDLKP